MRASAGLITERPGGDLDSVYGETGWCGPVNTIGKSVTPCNHFVIQWGFSWSHHTHISFIFSFLFRLPVGRYAIQRAWFESLTHKCNSKTMSFYGGIARHPVSNFIKLWYFFNLKNNKILQMKEFFFANRAR